LFGKLIKATLFAPVPVACAFVIGAFVILWAERRQRTRPATIRIGSVDDMRWPDALKVGFAQALALLPARRGQARPSLAACCSDCRALRQPSSRSSSPSRRCSRPPDTK
jgi:hypothetical protein